MPKQDPSLSAQLVDAKKRIRELESAERAQFYLKAIVDSAEDAIIGKTLDGIVTSWNHAAQEMYGYAPEEMIGQPIDKLIPADHPNEEPEIIARLRRGERIEHYETQRVRKNGTIIDVSLTISPIKDKSGNTIGASKIARNITERKLAEAREREALEQAQVAREAAERANRTKDEFLATVSHELRTPLTAILGWTKILESESVDPASWKKALEVIERNVKAQTQLVDELLDISRIISGKLRIESQPVELSAVISASIDVIRPAADAKEIRVQTVLDSGAGPITGDFQRLQQVIWNLLSNAVKFTPKGGRIRVELSREQSAVRVLVTDNGIGIRTGFLPYVFDRFSQADSSITRTHGGLGVGLAISKSIVELHGGTISVTSEGEGEGTTFEIVLPVAPIKNVGKERPLTGEIRRSKELQGVKILVVDDEVDTCEMLRFLFAASGAEVQTATSADVALGVIEAWTPDVLVSDIGMPDVDGYELIKRVRKAGRKVPAVALTALTRIEDRVRTLAAGYQMHVAKPVEPIELLTVVTSLLNN